MHLVGLYTYCKVMHGTYNVKLNTSSSIIIYLGISVYSVCAFSLNISKLHDSFLQSCSARINLEKLPFIIRMKDNCPLLIYVLKSRKLFHYTKNEIMNKLYRNLSSDILSSQNLSVRPLTFQMVIYT